MTSILAQNSLIPRSTANKDHPDLDIYNLYASNGSIWEVPNVSTSVPQMGESQLKWNHLTPSIAWPHMFSESFGILNEDWIKGISWDIQAYLPQPIPDKFLEIVRSVYPQFSFQLWDTGCLSLLGHLYQNLLPGSIQDLTKLLDASPPLIRRNNWNPDSFSWNAPLLRDTCDGRWSYLVPYGYHIIFSTGEIIERSDKRLFKDTRGLIWAMPHPNNPRVYIRIIFGGPKGFPTYDNSAVLDFTKWDPTPEAREQELDANFETYDSGEETLVEIEKDIDTKAKHSRSSSGDETLVEEISEESLLASGKKSKKTVAFSPNRSHSIQSGPTFTQDLNAERLGDPNTGFRKETTEHVQIVTKEGTVKVEKTTGSPSEDIPTSQGYKRRQSNLGLDEVNAPSVDNAKFDSCRGPKTPYVSLEFDENGDWKASETTRVYMNMDFELFYTETPIDLTHEVATLEEPSELNVYRGSGIELYPFLPGGYPDFMKPTEYHQHTHMPTPASKEHAEDLAHRQQLLNSKDWVCTDRSSTLYPPTSDSYMPVALFEPGTFEKTFNTRDGVGYFPQGQPKPLGRNDTYYAYPGTEPPSWTKSEKSKEEKVLKSSNKPSRRLAKKPIIDRVPNIPDDTPKVKVIRKPKEKKGKEGTSKMKRSVNAWIAYRTYHQSTFKADHQSKVSGKILVMWNQVPTDQKAKWAEVAREYSERRDANPDASQQWTRALLATMAFDAGLIDPSKPGYIQPEVLPQVLPELPKDPNAETEEFFTAVSMSEETPSSSNKPMAPALHLTEPKSLPNTEIPKLCKRFREEEEPEFMDFGRIPKKAKLIHAIKEKKLASQKRTIDDLEERPSKRVRFMESETWAQKPMTMGPPSVPCNNSTDRPIEGSSKSLRSIRSVDSLSSMNSVSSSRSAGSNSTAMTDYEDILCSDDEIDKNEVFLLYWGGSRPSLHNEGVIEE